MLRLRYLVGITKLPFLTLTGGYHVIINVTKFLLEDKVSLGNPGWSYLKLGILFSQPPEYWLSRSVQPGLAWSFFPFKLYLFVWEWVGVGRYTSRNISRGQRTTCRHWFSLSTTRVLGFNKGCQSWQWAPLPSKPFLWLWLEIFIKLENANRSSEILFAGGGV